MGKRKSTSRKGHRKVHRNRYVVINRARGVVRRLARNATVGSIDAMEKIVFPALGATGGLLLAQWLGTKVGPHLLPAQDPRLLLAAGSTVAAYGAYIVGDSFGFSPETQMMVAAGAGVAGLLPWIPPSMLAAASTTPSAAPAPSTPMSGYYQRGMLNGLMGGLMVDISHAGSPYKGMLGLGSDPADQSAVDNVLTIAEGVSTVEPMDMALPAVSKKAVRRVREQMGTPGDRGWAGGTFARNIFSAMSG